MFFHAHNATIFIPPKSPDRDYLIDVKIFDQGAKIQEMDAETNLKERQRRYFVVFENAFLTFFCHFRKRFLTLYSYLFGYLTLFYSMPVLFSP